MTSSAPLAPRTDSAIASADGSQARFLTGEAVHLEVRIARIGSRMLARLIDLVVQIVLMFALLTILELVLGLMTLAGVAILDEASITVVTILSTIGALIGYPVLMETLTRGRTLGKLILGLRVVRDDGGPLTFRHALSRNLVGLAIEFPGIILPPLTWLATVTTMLASPTSKRLGDHVAGTIVIHDRAPAAWGWAPQMPPGLATWAATLDLTGLDDDLALTVRHYLSRNRQIREPARTQLGDRLAREVAAVTNPPPPAGTPGWAYLAAVHAERHLRAVRQLIAVRARAAAVWPDLVQAVGIPTPPAALVAPYHTPRPATPTQLPPPEIVLPRPPIPLN